MAAVHLFLRQCSLSFDSNYRGNSVRAPAIDSGGGGIASSKGTGFTVTTSTIANNTADFVAGISNSGSTAKPTDCTIVQNTTISDQGGVNTFSNTQATINGTIIARNTAPDLSSAGAAVVGSDDLIGDGSDMDTSENTNATPHQHSPQHRRPPTQSPPQPPCQLTAAPPPPWPKPRGALGIARGGNFPVLDAANNGDITANRLSAASCGRRPASISASVQLPPPGAATRLAGSSP